MTVKHSPKKLLIIITLLILGSVVTVVYRNRFSPLEIIKIGKPSEESFKAPGKDWPSQKKVEDYFVEHLHMTQEQAKESRSPSKGNDGKISLRLTQESTLPALLSNLEYYGFIRDQESLQYALIYSVDTVRDRSYSLKVGDNTIDLYASYRISEDMTTWEIADQLLNHPSYFAYDENGYIFIP
ncbi:MAG: hypothetical protein ABI758_05715 [Candidatus Woesebacteria bacterium]